MASHDYVPSLANLTLADLDDEEEIQHLAQVPVAPTAAEIESTPTAGQRWFAPETTVERRTWKGPDEVVTESTGNDQSSMGTGEPSAIVISRQAPLSNGTSEGEADMVNCDQTRTNDTSDVITVVDQKRKRDNVLSRAASPVFQWIRSRERTSGESDGCRPNGPLPDHVAVLGVLGFSLVP
nr:hypothetical protein Iba_chr08dCG12090 [Ipomoea batatas]